MQGRRELRRYMVSVKAAATCPDCVAVGMDGRWPAEVMQFDHVPERGAKLGTINEFVTSRDEAGMLAEMAKCDIVCANHHAMRTKARGRSAETLARMSVASRIAQNRPEVKAAVSAAVRASWQDPAQRQRKLDGMKRARLANVDPPSDVGACCA